MGGSEMGILAILALLVFGGSFAAAKSKKPEEKKPESDEQADFQKDNITYINSTPKKSEPR